MKALIVLAAVVLELLVTADLQAQRIRVGIVGDQTSSRDLAASYEMLRKGIDLLGKKDINVLLHTGDLIESTRSEEEVRADFRHATTILNSIGRPWHLTPGDHDVNAAPFKQDSEDRSRENLYRELYRAHESGLTGSLDHSFNIGRYHFIALNSQRHLHSDPRWGNVFLAKITDEQIRWLARDLEANKRSAGIVVFMHQPLWYNWGSWTQIHELLRGYPVAAVVAGHFHYSQDEGALDGIRYVVAGATGGITKNSNAHGPTSPQVMVMTLNGRKTTFELFAIDGGRMMSFMPRAAMDRLQALDIGVGSIGVAGASSICGQSGQIYSDYAKRIAAVVELTAVGNAIDVPIRLHIAPVSQGVLLKNALFAPGACMAVDRGDCILRPSDRVAFSNNSSVRLDDYNGPLPALWSSELVYEGADPREAVQLSVRASFESASGELFVDHVSRIPIKTCGLER